MLGKLSDGTIRVVYYREGLNKHSRGVVDFTNKTFYEVLEWIETYLFFEKERITVI